MEHSRELDAVQREFVARTGERFTLAVQHADMDVIGEVRALSQAIRTVDRELPGLTLSLNGPRTDLVGAICLFAMGSPEDRGDVENARRLFDRIEFWLDPEGFGRFLSRLTWTQGDGPVALADYRLEPGWRCPYCRRHHPAADGSG